MAPVDVVGLCDVDRNQLDKAAGMVTGRLQNHTRPKLYKDYRDMLSETRPEIVLIGTPDHWHALQTIDADVVAAGGASFAEIDWPHTVDRIRHKQQSGAGGHTTQKYASPDGSKDKYR